MIQLRRRAKWACLIFVVAFFIIDIASIWWTFGIKSAPGTTAGDYAVARFGWGRMSVYWDGNYSWWPPQFEVAERHYVDFRWDFEYERTMLSTETVVRIPLWAIVAAGMVPTALLWWLDRGPRRRDQCQKCGYDLRGLEDGAVCPECGKAAPSNGQG